MSGGLSVYSLRLKRELVLDVVVHAHRLVAEQLVLERRRRLRDRIDVQTYDSNDS